ncbi:hypothetical protein [Cellulomonas dongxiuzhuiae]|uniref:hypothetical protein n=1 Tax=Cellulomonas dongxiuzhuiae TaxID=2819979 RepID=UPI0020369E7B|nr:hypothetical protein [Cellulomonas dongxiuzhuiae]
MLDLVDDDRIEQVGLGASRGEVAELARQALLPVGRVGIVTRHRAPPHRQLVE